MDKLAILGGPKAVGSDPGDIFKWPIITEEDEAAMLEVLRAGNMSGTDVTVEFEKEFAAWHGTEYALAHNTGTAALHSAMWACGLRAGDEIISQSATYWATFLPALNLGAAIVFADIDPDTLTLDPADVERKITDRTRVIMTVHLSGYPTDMDPIMAIANARGIKVIEDVSHAHGALYKGRLVGTLGHVGAMSCMSGKSFAVGEGGMLITNDKEIYERAAAFGHYERTSQLEDPSVKPFAGLPLGGFKYRMHQLSSAVGRVQLKSYQERMEEIQQAMNHFWDLLEGAPGLRSGRPPKESGSTMGGWYATRGIYVPEELDGLSIETFCDAVRAEGVSTRPGGRTLHLHPLLNDVDVYGHGKPTRLAHTGRDVRQLEGSLPQTERMAKRRFSTPWFKRYRPDIIKEYAEAFRKVVTQAGELPRDQA
ncbi:MAG: DegT/DnrJ/EryC1/StrS family aminotransferase [Candidatus Latescibacteria bacterium]|jgi:dTDP-4-amino-4,6-dideoxygalactose transaminase|nr:DegT/DnrJ/EryC1/StrS family aminotransferase [Candidatus Latescibacterota bacterium]